MEIKSATQILREIIFGAFLSFKNSRFLQVLSLWILILVKFSLKKCKYSWKSKFRASKVVKMANFALLEYMKFISRKIWVVEIFWNLHTVRTSSVKTWIPRFYVKSILAFFIRLISHKIWVAEILKFPHCVQPFHLQLLNLHNLICVTIERFFAAQYQNYSLAVAVFQTLWATLINSWIPPGHWSWTYWSRARNLHQKRDCVLTRDS